MIVDHCGRRLGPVRGVAGSANAARRKR